MPESIGEAYKKAEPYRKKVQKFMKDFEPGSDGRLVTVKRRFVTMGSEYTFGDLYKEIRKIIGAPINTLMYRVGVKAGFDAGKNILAGALAKECSSDLELCQTWAGGLGFYFGWGIILIDEQKKGRELLFRVYNGWEAESYTTAIGKSDEPVCHFMRGFFAGATAAIYFRTDMEHVKGEETKCTTKGDPYCEFVVRMAKPK